MEENKKEAKKDKIERPHKAKVIDYNKEPWLTDIIVYQKGSKKHAHMTLSGAQILYLRDAEDKEIIKEDFQTVHNLTSCTEQY